MSNSVKLLTPATMVDNLAEKAVESVIPAKAIKQWVTIVVNVSTTHELLIESD